jgi:hypothetical protein
MEHEPIVQMGSARVLPGYMYCKSFIVVEGTGAEVYKWGSRRGHSFILGLHTTILQADIYTINACIMENIEKGYICILANSQAIIKALDCSDEFQISLRLPSVPGETGRTQQD